MNPRLKEEAGFVKFGIPGSNSAPKLAEFHLSVSGRTYPESHQEGHRSKQTAFCRGVGKTQKVGGVCDHAVSIVSQRFELGWHQRSSPGEATCYTVFDGH